MPSVVERSLWPSACEAASTPATRRSSVANVPGAVHVEAGADAVADEPCLLEHPVPPAMDGVRGARLLRLGPVDAPIRRALLRVEEVVVRLGTAADELEWLAEVRLQRHDDPSAERNDSLLLALAEDHELPSGEIEVSDAD